MSKKITFYIGACIACLMMNSCDIESSDNGDLDGFWHLECVDTLSTNGTCDYREQRIFWGIQHKLLSVSDYDTFNNQLGYLFRFQQTGDSLIINSPYKNNWHQDQVNGGDIPIKEMNDTLRRCGINHLEEHYFKEKMNGSKMILRSKTLRLYFTKF